MTIVNPRVAPMASALRALILAALCVGCAATRLLAQTTDCVVTGYLFNTDGSPALNAQVHATRVERDGSTFRITPLVLNTDANGSVTLSALRGSMLWIAGSAVGSSQAGDVGILIPDNPTADLNVVGASARPPVSGFSVTDGLNPVMLLALPDFGINLSAAATPPPTSVQSINGRTGAVTLTASDIAATLVSVGGSSTASAPPTGLVYSTSAALSSLANAAAGKILTSSGVDDVPAWTSTPTLAIDNTGSGTFLKVAMSDHGAVGSYNFAVGYADNPGDASRGDHVFTAGFNTTPSGGPAQAGEPAFEWRIEDYYAPGGGAPGPYVEGHWQYYDATGSGFRPLAMQIDRNPGKYRTNATVNITSTGFSYLGMNGTQYAKFTAGELLLLNSMLVDSYTNNQGFLRQLNSRGDGFVRLPYVDAADRIRLGDGGPDILWGKALVPLGGGPVPIFGTTGGNGPQAAAQNSWMRVIDSTGAAFWIPVWK